MNKNQKLTSDNQSTAKRVSPIQHKLKALPYLSILAVDDVAINLVLLSTFLKDSNVKLTTSNSGKAALEYCHEHEYDLILMDIQMPIMDGVETTKHIRKIEKNMGTPIVAVTAHAFDADKHRFLNSGFDDFLAKPILLENLLDLILTWCAKPSEIEVSPDKTIPLESEHTSIVDWELALTRANFNDVAAQDLLSKFMVMLPDIIQEIRNDDKEGNIKAIQDNIHKLHGACCYTGVPKLQHLCFEIESGFKTQQLHNLDSQLERLMKESISLIEHGQALLAKLKSR